MTQPEMSYAPAYYQDSRQFIPAYHPRAPVPAAYYPPEQQSLPRHSLGGSPPRHPYPSERPSARDPTRTHRQPSDPFIAQPHRHSLSPSSRPLSDQRPVAPSPHGSSSTRASNSSGATATVKESRSYGSWPGPSPYMSNENHVPHGVSRVQKRTYLDDDSDEGSPDGLLMLFRLSIPIPIFSLGAAIYTIVGLFFVLLTSPLRLCSIIPRDTTFRSRLCTLLCPALHIHERLICLPSSRTHRTPSTQSIYVNESYPYPSGESDPSDGYSLCGLVAVLILSAFLCIPLLLVTWTVAFFWIFAMILGNPDGTEKRDDGRAAVLGVMRWWQKWLGYARRS